MEIKFRAWSPKWNKMIYHGVDGYTIDVHAKTAWFQGCDDECIQLLQFIGLKDENNKGKDIYQGDIYQVANNVIYWIDYLTNDKDDEFIASFGLKNERNEFPIDHYAIEKGRVIGNIYENEELLTK